METIKGDKMSKFGKNYAETIAAKPSKKTEDRVARQKACIDYKAAKKKYKSEKPVRLQKMKEEQEEIVKTRPDRITAKKAKKLEKNKTRREKQAKKKVIEEKVIEPVVTVPAVETEAVQPAATEGETT